MSAAVLEARLVLETMVFVLGVVAASLLCLLVTPWIVRRAVRRTRAVLEASLPQSPAEIDAGLDRLRARHAQAERRLEQAIGRLNERIAARMVEANRQREEIAAVTARQAELTAALAGMERRAAELTTTLERTDHRLSAATAELVMREERLNERAAEMRHLKSNIAIRDLLTEEQRLELVERETAIGNLNDALATTEATAEAISADRDSLATELAAERLQLAERTERIRAIETARDVLVADRDERIQTAEAARDALAAERAEHFAEPDRRATEIKALETALAGAEVLRQEAAALDETLAALRAENTELRRTAGTGRESERQDDVHLREQLDEIAARVARMSEARPARLTAASGNGHADAAPGERAAEAPVPLEKPPSSWPDPRSPAARLRALQRAGAQR